MDESTDPRGGFHSRASRRALGVLTLMYLFLQLDRSVISILLTPLKQEFSLSDAQLGFLPLAFSLVFAVSGLPLGLWADRGQRRHVVAACLLVFSAMTAVCSAVQSYGQLLLARFGVGAGEAGCGPAAMSLIAELFPPAQRARAMALFYVSTPVAMLLVFVGGAWVVGQFGWRMAFLAAGLPGMLVVPLVLWLIREPQRSGQAQVGSVAPRLGASLAFFRRQPALMLSVTGLLLTALSSASVLIWFMAFLGRSHGLGVREAGSLVGVLYGLVSLLGVAAGGWGGDRFAAGLPARRALFLAWASAASAPLLLGALLWPDRAGMTWCFALWALFSSLYYGPTHALCQSLVQPRQRATLASLIYTSSAIISAGLGPQLVGLASDLMGPRLGAESLRLALLLAVLSHVAAALCFKAAAPRVGADMARAGG